MSDLHLTISNLWILIATAMVFIMHLGFAALEAGFTRSKNTVNILFKNIGVISIGLLSFAFLGYSLMYPGEVFSGGFFGFSGFGLPFSEDTLTQIIVKITPYILILSFRRCLQQQRQTIVSGAIAERMKLSAFLIFSLLLVGVSYPITGMWKWGGGFLDTLSVPFYDFAGSTLVHSVGGWAALVAAIMIGPRLGRYDGTATIRHSFALSTIGVLLLWFGWFGFNGGSVLSASPFTLSLVFVTTALGGAWGCRLPWEHLGL